MVPTEFQGFWTHVRQGVVAFPWCTSCARFHWYPMQRCPHCRSQDITWRPTTGVGTLFSWTVIRHRFDPADARELPYVVALIEFADAPGVRLVGNLDDVDAADLVVGMSVRARIASLDDPVPRIAFVPA